MYDDEFAGQGGSYTQDPKTGKRTRIEEPTRTDELAVSVDPLADIPAAKAKKTAVTDLTQGA